MFGLFTRARTRKPKTPTRRPRLTVEALETRDCPSFGPSLFLDTPSVMPDHQVLLTGHVSATNPSNYTVVFAGAALGATTTDASGYFSVQTSNASLGTVLAVATKGLQIASTSKLLSVLAPNVTLSLMYASPTTVTLTGTVTDLDAGMNTVSISGVASGTATCDSSGNFTITTSFSGVGAIDAVATNLWGLSSSAAEVIVTAPPTVTLTTQVLPGHQVLLSGDVTGDHAANAMVAFSGAVVGSVMTDSNGHFSFVSSNATLGTVSAVAIDALQHTSDPVSAQISVTAPTISLAITQVDDGYVVLSGHVNDVDGGEMVNISGAMNDSVVTDANGDFSFTMSLLQFGTVNVSAQDLWGLASNTAQVAANAFPPMIQNFQIVNLAGNQWTVSGTVVGINVEGLTVNFGGLASLVGQATTVAADGSFSLLVTLTDFGTATAQTSQDGLASNLATYVL